MAPAYRLVTIALVVVTTMIAFESMAVTTAMPLAAAELGSVESYGLAFSAMMTGMLLGIVLAGPWADRAGPLPGMYAGQGLFLAGTLACVLAPSIGPLLLGRVVTGLGAGLVIVVEFVAVGRVFPAAARPRVFTWLSAAWVLPSLVGAPLAGWIATSLSWRWVFGAVVLPAVLAMVLIVSRRDLLAHGATSAAAGNAPAADAAAADADPDSVGAQDEPGASPADRAEHLRLARLGVAVAAAAGVAQLAIHEQPSPLSALGVGGLLAVVALAWSAPRLLPDGTTRARRGLPAVVLSRAIFNGAFMGSITFVPLLLNRERGVALTTAGAVLALASLGWSTGSWWQGHSRLRGPTQRARLVIRGAGLLTTGLVALTVLALWEGAPLPALAAALAIGGLGMGVGSTTLSVLILDLTPEAEHGRASAALQLADVLGTVIGIAAATALFAAVHRDGESTAYVVIWAALAAVAAVGLVVAPRCAPAAASAREDLPATKP